MSHDILRVRLVTSPTSLTHLSLVKQTFITTFIETQLINYSLIVNLCLIVLNFAKKEVNLLISYQALVSNAVTDVFRHLVKPLVELNFITWSAEPDKLNLS